MFLRMLFISYPLKQRPYLALYFFPGMPFLAELLEDFTFIAANYNLAGPSAQVHELHYE